MANWVSKQKGKALKVYNKVTKDPKGILTGEINKSWRALILLNRLTSGLPKDHSPHGKKYIPNKGALTHEGVYGPNTTRNPKTNRAIKDNWRSSTIQSGHDHSVTYHNSPSLRDDSPNLSGNYRVVVRTLEEVQKLHQTYKGLSNKDNPGDLKLSQMQKSGLKGRVGWLMDWYGTSVESKDVDNGIYIINLTPGGEKLSYSYIKLQNRPSELTTTPEPYWATIKSMGRNVPMYQYTGAEDTLDFTISWYWNGDNQSQDRSEARKMLINRCRILESWTKANSYIASPPVLRLRWGFADIFNNHLFILVKCLTTYSNFQTGYVDRRVSNPIPENAGLCPMVATQELTFKRVSPDNLYYQDYYDESLNTTDPFVGTNKDI